MVSVGVIVVRMKVVGVIVVRVTVSGMMIKGVNILEVVPVGASEILAAGKDSSITNATASLVNSRQ